MDTDKITIGIATAIILALLSYPYVQIPELRDRVIALEKDRQYLQELFDTRLKDIERQLDE